MNTRQLRVSGGTNVNRLSGAILSVIDEGAIAELISIGAIAVNQAIKATIVAQGNGYKKGKILTSQLSFTSVTLADGEKRDAIKITIRVPE